MAEINNNIPNFGYKKIEKIEKQEPAEKVIEQENKPQEEKTYAPDPGILGRSQVKRANGGNIAKTIEETVAIANNNPAVMCCCEDMFDKIYNDLIKEGMNESDAYMKALLAEEELLAICPQHN